MSQELGRAVAAYREGWLEAIRAVVSAGGPHAPEIASLDGSIVESGEDGDICWLQLALTGAITGRQALAMPRGSVKALARLVAQRDAESERDTGLVIDDPLQVLTDQAGPRVAAAVGVDISFASSGSAASDWKPAASFSWRIDCGATEPIILTMYLDEALTTGLESALVDSTSMQSDASDITVSMLRDVRIPTTMRLGEVEVALSDVLGFGAGAVQAVDPPYGTVGELSVGGRVMARGQIVLVGGNYGLRITELAGESARMAMLQNGDLAG